MQKLFVISPLWILTALLLTFVACQPEETDLTVTGTVSNAAGNPLSGVTITNSSSATVLSDAAGKYSIPADKNSLLRFELANYLPKTIEVNGQTTLDVVLEIDPWVAAFSANNNSIKDPQFPSNSLIPSITLPAPSSTDPWFTAASYAGAVPLAFGSPWYSGWSFSGSIISGNLTSAALNIAGKPTVVVNDNWMRAQGTTINWRADTVYILDSLVFVESGQTLHIAAGTVVQGKSGNAAGASALIIAKGAKIMAVGTPTAPIVFTYEGDMGNSSAGKRGQWGGLVLLGEAGLNSSPGETQLAGIPATDSRGLYGGNNDLDNSGTLQYVSIRHGGTNIGNSGEISGLTLGGVGSGTVIEYVEVVSSRKDGVEWLGGTANSKYLLATYCGEDALTYDEGYRGNNQFVIVYQAPNTGGYGGNHEGGTAPQRGTPFATPQFWNVTSVGNPNSQALIFADNAGGQYHNSIFINYDKGVSIEEESRQEQDSYKQFVDGNLVVANCVFYNIGSNSGVDELFFVDYIQ